METYNPNLGTAGSTNPQESSPPCNDAHQLPADYFHGVIDYIQQMLMEDNDESDQLHTSPCGMFLDCSALQDAEKYFHHALSHDAGFPPWPDSSSEGIGKKQSRNRAQGNDFPDEIRRSKIPANCADDESDIKMENFDKAFLCRRMNPGFYDDVQVVAAANEPLADSDDENIKRYRKTTEPKRGRPKGSKKNSKARDVIDFMSLLTRAAQAASEFNFSAAQELLRQIRQHSSPYGDPNERLAHCFTNALEARMAGTGSAMYAALASRRIPTAELLKGYKTYVQGSPFKRMSNLLASKSIGRHAREATRIHIIDFGILYGFQWPCIIQGFSLRPGGPPQLRITGIDFPQSGFRPTERVEQTGRRLMSYCRRFNVPFEYNAIAKRWEDITLEDVRIEPDELVIVSCMHRLRHVPDESASMDSPRDAVLKLIKEINPGLFVIGVINGTYGAPFFDTRFRDALYHYSSYFDMMEGILPREDQDRLMYEREVFGRDVMNVIACEGSERIERPETYKKWHVRNQRAGFEPVPLNQELMKEVTAKVRKDYHSNFLLDEDSGWMLQGWKGKVMYALSFWKPSPE